MLKVKIKKYHSPFTQNTFQKVFVLITAVFDTYKSMYGIKIALTRHIYTNYKRK